MTSLDTQTLKHDLSWAMTHLGTFNCHSVKRSVIDALLKFLHFFLKNKIDLLIFTEAQVPPLVMSGAVRSFQL